MKNKALRSTITIIICVALIFTFIVSIGKLVRPYDHFFDVWEQYYNEDDDTLNVLFIGSSSMYRYWIPTQAYEKYGFTSYLLTHPGQNFKATPYILEEALKSQDFDLVVVETRRLYVEASKKATGTFDQETTNYYLSMITAGMNPSLTRAALINDVLVTTAKDKKIEYIFSFLKYHNNLFDFTAEEWKARLSLGKDAYKSAEQVGDVKVIKELDYTGIEAGELTDDYKQAIDDLETVAKENDVNLLLMSTPYVTYKSRYPYYLAMNEYIAEKGYEYLDLTSKYDEIGMSLLTDYYNENHPNIKGAQKFTDWFADYLVNNYEFTDKLNDNQKKEWDEVSDAWNEHAKEILANWKINLANLDS